MINGLSTKRTPQIYNNNGGKFRIRSSNHIIIINISEYSIDLTGEHFRSLSPHDYAFNHIKCIFYLRKLTQLLNNPQNTCD